MSCPFPSIKFLSKAGGFAFAETSGKFSFSSISFCEDGKSLSEPLGWKAFLLVFIAFCYVLAEAIGNKVTFQTNSLQH